ncbi:DUF3450 domain-containing protein [Ferrimonas balearica]|uniref:DUF3450 domain-containing protein n=1 Tax=Ferrimonas balearica TaxID=44012 RepID=UPI001C99D829|nr:DUF3450 domain-containing protein [Ferrimonas balearica]MBY5920920.1 DUF3450 domain-containing protein [Ferrimonas balearica]MBY5996395.1 DUF3450 domain-containing protein [Ferrimonas balearica]
MKSRALGIVCALMSGAAMASSLPQAEQNQQALQNAARDTQTQVDQLTEQQLNQQAELERVKEEISNLTVYRDHLKRLVADQQRELESLDGQLAGIEQTRSGLVPLMYRMLDDLNTLVEDDMPLKSRQRQARLADLNQMMGRADVADAEKFRRLLEAYQIEMEYGRRLGTYRDTLMLDGQSPREVEFLHLGRLALIARSLDGREYWVWQSGQWRDVAGISPSLLSQAYGIAAGHQAPALLTLPLSQEIQ